MTKEEAIEQLKSLQNEYDIERAHARADDVLCELLRTLGYEEVVKEWDEIDKWYA